MMLVVNAGSSSLKYALFTPKLDEILDGRIEEIGTPRAKHVYGTTAVAVAAPDHQAAITLLLGRLTEAGHPPSSLTAAAHRVVHGGTRFSETVKIGPEVLATIEEMVPLAPLHNPANLAPIKALQNLAPELPQYAAFDTAFHTTIPEVVQAYALPADERARGLRRYGFHGLSYAALARRLPDVAGHMPERVLACHLGNGASLCAIKGGRSVASSMGYSAVSGLTMGTRAGEIDATAVLDLADRHGTEGAANILNRKSGLKALGGTSDMRALHAASTGEAKFAIDHFVTSALREAGGMIALMGGLDAVVFTGGIGENDQITRARILNGLAFLGVDHDSDAGGPKLHRDGSRVTAWVIPAAEEEQIALEAYALLEAR
ncbi:MAG: acetate/propionate family kinase [Pseudomonadota bacterium]